MAVSTYNQVRFVLRRMGFEKVRIRKHETGEKVLPNGVILQVRLSHKGKRDIPTGIFKEILRQAGLDEKMFQHVLKKM